MKNILKKICISFVVSICLFIGMSNIKAAQEQYEEKSIDILGLTIWYQDKVYFDGENDITRDLV